MIETNLSFVEDTYNLRFNTLKEYNSYWAIRADDKPFVVAILQRRSEMDVVGAVHGC